jgi:hypothetical protein
LKRFKKITVGFARESYYDLYDDWDLIESSFLKQYGIRIRALSEEEDLSWSEFSNLLAGIMPDTPLGSIVSIRAEKDPKVIKQFTEEQRRIRNDWVIRKNKKLRESPSEYKKYVNNLQTWCKAAFGKKK